MPQMTISADDAAALFELDNGDVHNGWTRLDDETISTGRWMERCWLIITRGEGVFGIRYEIGLTEEQPNEYPWEDDDVEELKLTPLVGVPVTTTKYLTEKQYEAHLAKGGTDG